MTKSELMDHICNYARTNMASKATSKVTQFVLGAMSGGIGRSVLEGKLSPIADLCADASGNLKWNDIKSSITAGFGTSNTVPVLGGIISLDMNDANDFFAFVESRATNLNCASPTATVAVAQTPA